MRGLREGWGGGETTVERVQRFREPARFAECGGGEIVGHLFAFDPDAMRQPPRGRMMEQQRLGETLHRAVGIDTDIAALATYVGMEIAATSKVSASVRADSRSRCRISANGKHIEAIAVGRCTVFVSVETGDTTVIKRIPLRITKK